VQVEFECTGGKDRRTFTRGVLDDRDGNAGGGGGVNCPRNDGQGLLVRRVLNFKGAAEVLLLHVDEDEGAAGDAHVLVSPDGNLTAFGDFSSLPAAADD
jgi:hypothetical protein